MTVPSSSPSLKDAVFAERIGTLVRGKWKLEALRGVGAMAAVYEAQQENGERAALKILHANFAHDKEACERFAREAVVAKKVEHPGAVRVLEHSSTDQGEPFLVMELLDGETVLDTWRKVGRQMAIIPALQIAERIIDCLVATHAAGVIHRDLKPANVFLTATHEVKVLDFGVALLVGEEAAERVHGRSAMGTPAYMSPEQAMGRDLDGRTDLFSVGAMLHVLITGHRINAAKTEAESLVLAASRPAPSVKTVAPNLPAEVTRLIDRALAWDRQSRFADAGQMQQAALDALAALGGEPLAEPGGAPRAVVFDLGGAPTRAPVSLTFTDRSATSGRNARLRTFFVHLDRALAALAKHGAEHQSVQDALVHALEVFTAVSPGEDQDAGMSFRVEVLPYGFVAEGGLVWEPTTSDVPYRLFESGVRALTFAEGLDLEELRELVSIASKQEGKDLPPDDDLRSALWERALPHLDVSAAPGLAKGTVEERRRFLDDVAAVRTAVNASVIERADSIDAGACAATPPLVFDEELRASAAPQLGMGIEEWTLRYLDAAVFGYVGAQNDQERAAITGSLHSSARGLLWSGRLLTVVGVYHGMSVRLNQFARDNDELRVLLRGLAEALFGGDNLSMAVRLAGTNVATGKLLAIPLGLLGTSLEAELERAQREAAEQDRAVELAAAAARDSLVPPAVDEEPATAGAPIDVGEESPAVEEAETAHAASEEPAGEASGNATAEAAAGEPSTPSDDAPATEEPNSGEDAQSPPSDETTAEAAEGTRARSEQATGDQRAEESS